VETDGKRVKINRKKDGSYTGNLWKPTANQVDIDGEWRKPIARKVDTGQKSVENQCATGGSLWKAGDNQSEEGRKQYRKKDLLPVKTISIQTDTFLFARKEIVSGKMERYLRWKKPRPVKMLRPLTKRKALPVQKASG
jgi:hypothetical protein